jgi:uncharacterized protein YbjQ (UPF0145 family)
MCGCATVKYIPTTTRKYLPKDKTEEIKFTNGDISRPYKEIGFIIVTTEYTEAIPKEMCRKARKIGADAVIKVQYSSSTSTGTYVQNYPSLKAASAIPISSTTYSAIGLAVVYDDNVECIKKILKQSEQDYKDIMDKNREIENRILNIQTD